MSAYTGRPEAIRCTLMIRGLVQKNDTSGTICYLQQHAQSQGVIASVDPNTGFYDSDCQWRPYPSRQRASAFIMDHQYIAEPTTADTVKQAIGHYIHETTRSVSHELFVLHKEKNITKMAPDHTVENLNKVFRRDVARVDLSHFMEEQHHDLKDSHVIAITGSTRTSADVKTRETTMGAMNSSTKMSTISINNRLTHFDEHGFLHVGNSLGHSLLDRIRHALMEDIADALIVAQIQYHLSSAHSASGAVYIDETLSNHVTFLLHYEAELPFIDLRSPSGVIYGIESVVCSIDHDYKVIKFQFDFIEVGTWKFTLRQTSNKVQTLNVTVLSETGNSHTDPIILRQSIRYENEAQSAILLNVDATQGVHPVIGLNVTAHIELPDLTVASVNLLDNGAGADISKDDGIYSRYFLPLNQQGRYHVTFVVSGHFGQVFRKEESFSIDAENTLYAIKKLVHKRAINGNIQRHLFGGTVHKQVLVKNNHDVIAPSRIFDLHMVRYLPYRKTLVLSWTAPGDDLDNGKAFAYEVFTGSDVKDIRNFLEYVKTGSYTGKGWVTKKTIPAKEAATRRETLRGNAGRASNVATAVLVDKEHNH